MNGNQFQCDFEQRGCKAALFCLFLPHESLISSVRCFQFERQTDLDSGWYLGGKISEWEPWTLSGNQFLSSPPLSTACRSICISDISAFVFLRSFHLYFFKPLPSICSTQLLWHSIPFLLRSQLTNSLSLSTSSSSAKPKISVQERALLWYISPLSI